jgi:hypothetical protein
VSVSGKTDAQILDEVLASLSHPGSCCFWACPGPDAAFVHMATCVVCASIQDLRKLKRRWERQAA